MKEESDTEEVEFNWDEYLASTSSEAVPKACFRQHETPPVNEFEVGQKLEAIDPRNRSSWCIASVVDKLGPRLRLRLDGTDDRNDFWLLVDSEFIHPFEYTTKSGGTIHPPLGFRNNISTWPKFFDKLVQTAGENTFARYSCFKEPPPKPPRNEFKRGQKIEAVDQKNPHLICPATIKDVEKDQITVSFDGWSQSCNFNCHYTSRDIYPAGWCKLAKHPLQWPGSYEENKKSKARRSGGGVNTTITTAATTNQNSSFSKSNKNSENLDVAATTVLNTSKGGNAEPQEPVNIIEKSPLKQNNNNLNKPSTVHTNGVDLSIVKTESADNFNAFVGSVNKKEENLKSEHVNTTQQKNIANKLIVHVNPNITCNKYLNSSKFHANYKRFGPDSPKNLFKLILQAFINCAYDSTKIFDLIQDGDSTSYIKFKTPNRNERKHLPKIENEAQLWTNLDLMCKVFSISGSLFSKAIVNSTNNNENVNINGTREATHKTTSGLNDQPTSSRSNSIDSSSMNSFHKVNGENGNNHETSFNIDTSKLKRRSSSDESFTQNKLTKFDAENPKEWNVEQVGKYVSNTDPNLASHIFALKDQEIDGKALLLLTTDVMMKYMDMKLGPALKLSNLIERLKRR